jgi:hypothetical protein
VAIYDALLFLMVIILISVGMFLYTASNASDGGGFSDSFYQRITENQVNMVRALHLATPDEPFMVWSSSNNSLSVPMANLTYVPEAQTVDWVLQSYCELAWNNTEGDTGPDGPWEIDGLLAQVNSSFAISGMDGTNHTWMFLYEGEVIMFGTDSGLSIEELPDDRWASTRDYSKYHKVDGSEVPKYKAELRYFLWLE